MNTPIEESIWKDQEGLNRYVCHWPVQNAKAVIILVHGIGEHIRRYDHFAAYWEKKDIALIGIDHPGHGATGGKRGHASLASIKQGVQHITELASSKYNQTPLILYGHSMGGNVGLNCLLHEKYNFSAAIITGPWVHLYDNPSRALLKFGRIMRKIFPSYTQDTKLNTASLSYSEENIRKYNQDPLVHNMVSMELGLSLYDSASDIQSTNVPLHCQTLLLHGKDDHITNPTGTKLVHEKHPKQTSLHIFERMKHEIHNEEKAIEVFDLEYKWLKNTLPAI